MNIKWLGNKHKMEFHRIGPPPEKHPKQCQIDEIPDEHKVWFKRAKDAREAGYDPAYYCTAKFKSRH